MFVSGMNEVWKVCDERGRELPFGLSMPLPFPVICFLGIGVGDLSECLGFLFSHQVLKQMGVKCMVSGIGILLLAHSSAEGI